MRLVLDRALLKRARLTRALTQRDLAALAGVNPKTVEHAESGAESPRPTTIRKLAVALGVDPLHIADIVE